MASKQERNRLAGLRRTMIRTSRVQNRARRRIATQTPQPARVWLVNLGIAPDYAQRFASAFSRGMVPTTLSTTKIKLKKDSRRSERVVPVKLYGFPAVKKRIADYRPKSNPEAATEFARAALALAA